MSHTWALARTRAGFTLLELLVVLALAALAATVVGSGAQSFMERSRYHESVRGIATQLGRARAVCVEEGRAVVVTYDPQQRQLMVDGKHRLSIPPSLQVHWEPAQGQARSPLGDGQPIFVFNADGGAIGGRFGVARESGQGVAFQVNWLLGTVEQVGVGSS